MSYTLIKIADQYNSPQYKEFLMDSAQDAAYLPGKTECAPGSVAETADGTRLIMTPSGSWSVASSGSTSSGQITILSGDVTTLYESEITVASTDTSGAPLFEISTSLPSTKTYGALYAVIEDANGKRSGYFYRSETVMVLTSGATTTEARGVYTSVISSAGVETSHSYGGPSTVYGLFISSYDRTADTFKIYARYNSATSGILNGTYNVKVYAIATPDT